MPTSVAMRPPVSMCVLDDLTNCGTTGASVPHPWKGRGTRVIGCCSVIALLCLASCVSHRPVETAMPRLWAAGPSEVIAPDAPRREQTAYFDQNDPRIRLTGAVNETVAFEFILGGSDRFARGLEIGFEDLILSHQVDGSDGSPTGVASGRIPRGAVHIYRHWPVTVDRYPNWYLRSVGPSRSQKIPDALVPINAVNHGQPFTIAPKTNLVLWVEIKIPFMAAAGEYRGAIVVQDREGNSLRTPIELQVRDVFLSPAVAVSILARVQIQPIVRAFTDIDPQNTRLILSNDDSRRALMQTFRLLHDHGLCPVTNEIRPRFSQDLDGRVKLDWTDYDAFCGPLIDGSAYADGRAAAWWPLPVDLTQPDPAQYGGIYSTVYTAVLKKYISAAAAHFQSKGWLDRAYVFFDWPTEPNPTMEELEQVRRMATLTHLANDRLNVVSRLIPQPMAPFGWAGHRYLDLTPVIDIWSTPARYEHGPTMHRLQTLGRRTWLLPDRPPFSGSIAVEAPPIQARSLPWQAFLQGHDAIVLDHATDWPADVFDRPIGQRGDTWLVYPGSLFGLKGVVPSLRLKQLQLGIHDYQRLRLLEKNGRGETARLVAGSLIKAAGTAAYGDNYQDGRFGRRVNDPALWELGRRILEEELTSAMRQQARGTDDGGGAKRSDWARFLSSTRHIEARVESARLNLDERSDQEAFLMNYEVAIRNELRTPLEGTLTFGPLPPGTSSVSDVIHVGPIPEMGLVRKKLIAQSPHLPATDLDGHARRQIVFDAGTSGVVTIGATMSIVQAPPAPFAITVDGRLDDWPPTEANAAGDFRLLTAATPVADRFKRPKAKSQTLVYFCQAGGKLYIGVHAATPARPPTQPEPYPPLRNFVKYEDLMPVGEDLVEIMIDPTNAGTQSDDLFHLVLKSTGNPIFERGVRTTPPIGTVRPWPQVPPECCVVQTADGWTAEVAIPLSAFGEAAANRVWGINLARREPIRGEYSDWARAPRYCYDPRTLGNLVWPD